MNTRTRRRKYNYNEEIKDRLSNLPDCVLLHILSFFDAANMAVRTCILSKRWKNIWKILPTLALNSHNFRSSKNFTKFISKILSLRDGSTALSALYFFNGVISPQLMKRIMEYSFSHDIQHLYFNVDCPIQQFPVSHFSCVTLKSLGLYFRFDRRDKTLFPTSLNFPALTNLCLQGFIFCVNDDDRVDPFSTLNRLNSLMIISCIVIDNQSLSISSATLAKLEIKDCYVHSMRTNIGIKFHLSTPNLCNFFYLGYPRQKLCGSMNNLSSVKNVNIDVFTFLQFENIPLILLNWLIELANVESLTISQNILKVLSLVPNLLKIEFPSLYNLKSLKVIEYLPSSTSIPKEIVDFLIQNAPSAKVEILPPNKYGGRYNR